ncbi:MAG: nicotinate-nucleotide diphosphorylase (carboxylating), partial [Pseudorhodoplanes sp.]
MTNASLLCPGAFLSPLAIEEAVTRALAEDLGRAGDITSAVTVPQSATARAVMVTRKAGTLAGLPLAAATFRRLDPAVEILAQTCDGDSVPAGTALMTLSGSARAIL